MNQDQREYNMEYLIYGIKLGHTSPSISFCTRDPCSRFCVLLFTHNTKRQREKHDSSHGYTRPSGINVDFLYLAVCFFFPHLNHILFFRCACTVHQTPTRAPYVHVYRIMSMLRGRKRIKVCTSV